MIRARLLYLPAFNYPESPPPLRGGRGRLYWQRGECGINQVDAAYYVTLYRDYSRRRIAARGFRYCKVRYGIGLSDRAVGDTVSECIPDGGSVEGQSVRGNLGRADHAVAQILNELIRSSELGHYRAQ